MSPLWSGGAFHTGVEQGLLLEEDPAKRRYKAIRAGLAALAEDEGRLKRFGPGVESAIRALPDWVWEVERPVAEEKIEVVYDTPFTPEQLLDNSTNVEFKTRSIQMVGIPDLWYIAGDALHVIDFKSFGKSGAALTDKAKSYGDFTLQPRLYAVMLYDKYEWLKEMPIFTSFLVASTKGKCVQSEPYYMSESALDWTREYMLSVAAEVGTTTTPTFGVLCGWCEFKELDTFLLTGRDPSGIIEEQFEVRTS